MWLLLNSYEMIVGRCVQNAAIKNNYGIGMYQLFVLTLISVSVPPCVYRSSA